MIKALHKKNCFRDLFQRISTQTVLIMKIILKRIQVVCEVKSLKKGNLLQCFWGCWQKVKDACSNVLLLRSFMTGKKRFRKDVC